jgi:hypothetical protein
MFSKPFHPQKNLVPKAQPDLGDPWVDSESNAVPKGIIIPLERHLLQSDPSLTHEAIAQAGSPDAKVLGGATGIAILHPVKVLLKDELKIKEASYSKLWEGAQNALALMMWFHSPLPTRSPRLI